MEDFFNDPKRMALAGALGGSLGGAYDYATSPYTHYDWVGMDGSRTPMTKRQVLAAKMAPGVIGGGIGGAAAGYMNKHGYNLFNLAAKASRGRRSRRSRRSRGRRKSRTKARQKGLHRRLKIADKVISKR